MGDQGAGVIPASREKTLLSMRRQEVTLAFKTPCARSILDADDTTSILVLDTSGLCKYVYIHVIYIYIYIYIYTHTAYAYEQTRQQSCLQIGTCDNGVFDKHVCLNEKTRGDISFQSTTSGAGEQLLLPDCRATASTKAVHVFTHAGVLRPIHKLRIWI